MATKVVMAQLSPTMEEGRLVSWKVSEGDDVKQGDVVVEIETDKANMDVEAMGSGVLLKRVVDEGATVPVGTLIGVIGQPEEDISALLEEAGGAGDEAATAAADEEAPEGAGPEDGAEETGPEEAAETGTTAGQPAADREGGGAAVAAAGDGGGVARPAGRFRLAEDGEGERVKISPVARKMAEEAGLRVSRLSGSGPGGRIVKRDVEAALERGPAAGARGGPERLVEETVEPSQMRKAIARRLSESLGPVPHFFLTVEIDMGRALELRAELNERRAAGAWERAGRSGGGRREEEADDDVPHEAPKIGVNDLLLKAAAEALVRHPEINASWTDEGLRRHGSVDLGIAVALDAGLITPVLRDAERKGLEAIAREARDLIGRARARDLAPEEYQGATFSISNLGMHEIEEFTAIINPPEAAILAVGRTKETPVAVDGEVEVRKRMKVTMSCDHRVIDGAMGARFLETYKQMLENPLAMLL